MLLAFALCLLAPQKLVADPHPAEVGQRVVLTLTVGKQACADAELFLRAPNGQRSSLGRTGPAGELTYQPSEVGTHVIEANLNGVELLLVHAVAARRHDWLAAIALIPLSLALLWANLRGQPAAATQPSTRST